MQLLMKDRILMDISENGNCKVFDFGHLPFSLRKEKVTFIDFMEWASNRTLSIGRSYAKEILNSLRLPQTNRFAVCKACRGLSLEDSFWIRQDGDEKSWDEVNLFKNPLSLFITEISLSGRNVYHQADMKFKQDIHTPELTTMGASAKGWIRQGGLLYLHKVGKHEIPADMILNVLGIEHIHYSLSAAQEIDSFLTQERKEWIKGVGEAIVNTKLFTSEDTALVTFEEFRIFCEAYGMNPYREAMNIDRTFYLRMQIADFILNNNDRHEQNWGFLMDNNTGKLTGFCPLFDHDHAFADYQNVNSQTTEEEMPLLDAAQLAQRELELPLDNLLSMQCPRFLSGRQWQQVLERGNLLTQRI